MRLVRYGVAVLDSRRLIFVAPPASAACATYGDPSEAAARIRIESGEESRVR